MKKILGILYALSTIWWITIFVRGIQNTTENYLFNVPMAMLPISGGVYVLWQMNKRKVEYQPLMVRALRFMSIAIISWGLGNLVYLYYNLGLNNAVAYNSFADILYLFTSAFWVIGLFTILCSVGKKRLALYGLRRLFIFGAVIVFFGLAMYMVLLNQFRLPDVSPRFLFNIFYIFGDFVVFFELCLLEYVILSGTKHAFLTKLNFIFVGFCFNYVADIAYMMNQDTFFVGSWIDLLFFIGSFFQVIGVLHLLFLTKDKFLPKTKKVV